MYMNNEISALEGMKPRTCNLRLGREYHARGAYFRPRRLYPTYNDMLAN
jgi:hypothetical protein